MQNNSRKTYAATILPYPKCVYYVRSEMNISKFRSAYDFAPTYAYFQNKQQNT